MSATKKTSRPRARHGVFISWRGLTIALFVAVAAVLIFFALRKTPLERGMNSLIEAFSQRRLIEPRLAGGFKAAQYNPAEGDVSGIKQAELDRAREFITEALATGDAKAHLAYARLLVSERANNEGALKHLRVAVEAMPTSAEAHNDLGVFLIERDRLEDAIDEFDVALKHSPQMPEANFNRALCFSRLQLREAARSAYDNLAKFERDKGWLGEVRQRLEEASKPLPEPVTEEKFIEQLNSAINSGDAEMSRAIVRIHFERISRHTLSLWEDYLSGDPEKAGRALTSIESLARAAADANNDNTIATGANYLRSLPENQKQAELETFRLYRKGLIDFRDALKDLNDSKFEEALASFEQSRKEYESRGNELFRIRTGYAIARCQYYLDRIASSIETLENNLSTIRQRGWVYDESRTLLLIGLAYYRTGQDSTALRYLNQTREAYRKMGEPESKPLQYIGITYWHLGDFGTALNHFRRSTRLFLTSDPRWDELAYNYLNVADIYRLTERHKIARLYAEQALDISDKGKDNNRAAQSSSLIALAYANEQEFDKADEALGRAIDYVGLLKGSTREYTEPLVLVRAGEMAALRRNFQGAIDYYTRADAILSAESGDKIIRINALRGRAESYAKAGRGIDARNDLQLAIGVIEGYRENLSNREQRIEFLAASQKVYDQMINLDADDPSLAPQAFKMAESSRARALLDDISSPISARLRDDGKPSIKDDRINSGEARSTADLAEVKRALPVDMAIVEYSVTAEKTYIFLVTREGVEMLVSEASSTQLSRLVSDYISDIKHKAAINDLSAKARELHRLVIEPVEAKLGSYRTVCIVPDKALHYLPFAALKDETGRYFVESHRITYAPSASVLVECLNQRQPLDASEPEQLLAVGNPQFNRDEFGRLSDLAEAGREAYEVSKLYQGATLLVEKDATEESVRRQIKQCDVAHLALHCLVYRESPWTAALVLASNKPFGKPPAPEGSPSRGGVAEKPAQEESGEMDDPNDGLLYLREIYNLALPRTRLVVLSACESGLGQFYRGEGIVSLIHPFMAAHVSTVVASLWPVEDSAATSELMIEFHRARKSANLQAGDALRDAQLKMIERGVSHPYYWASFIVVGCNY